jgi:hypothetical protein
MYCGESLSVEVLFYVIRTFLDSRRQRAIALKLWILMTAILKRTQGELPRGNNLASLRKQWVVSML